MLMLKHKIIYLYHFLFITLRLIIAMLALVLSMLFFSDYAAAADEPDCVGKGADRIVTISPGPIVVSKDLPVGSVIGEYETSGGQEFWNIGPCSLPVTPKSMIFASGSTTTINGVSVFSTSVSGVGVAIAIRLFNGLCPQEYTFAASGFIQLCSYLHFSEYSPAIGQVKLVFYKTKATIAGGIVSGTDVAQLFLKCMMPMEQSCDNAFNGTIKPVISFDSFTVTPVACEINTPTLTFNMGDIAASKFGTEPGTVLTDNAQTQQLGLQCDPDVNVRATLSGTQNPDTSDSSVLALTKQGTAGVAKGVGVQIIYNGEPLQREQPLLLKHSEGGVETLPITLRYYQTQPVVSPGTANATATLTLTWQ